MGNNSTRGKDMASPDDVILFQGAEGAGKRRLMDELIPTAWTAYMKENTTSDPPWECCPPEWADYMKENNISVSAWECGGRTSMRPITQFHYKIVDVIVFVVDSANTKGLDFDRYELHQSLQEEGLKDTVFLILANKQDLPGALSVKEMSKVLELDEMKQQGTIFGTSVVTDEGIYEASEWLLNVLQEKKLSRHETTITVEDERKVLCDVTLYDSISESQNEERQCVNTGWFKKAAHYALTLMKAINKI